MVNSSHDVLENKEEFNLEIELLETTRWVVFLITTSVVVGLYLQAYKLWKTKSVDDFHPVTVVTLLCNEVAWLLYGVQIGEWPIIAVPTISIPAASIIAYCYFKYRKRRKNDRKVTKNI